MKKLIQLSLLFCMISSHHTFGQGFCITQKATSQNNSAFSLINPGPPQCGLMWIRVYIHRINSNGGNGYNSSIDNTIINNLNASYNQFGMFFVPSGSRTWYDDTFGNPNTDPLVLQGIINSQNNSFQSNAINIYVLPANSLISGGFVPNTNKQMLLIGGTRTITHCQAPATVQYEIATSKIVCHEMGHCFGLIHTFDLSGDDGLSDTPIDNVINGVGGQGCINTTNCQFTGSCNSCSLASNPTTNMINFMSYTTPPCMSYFSPLQLALMKYTINTAMFQIVSQTQIGGPDLTGITRDGAIAVNTINSISSGYHTIATNVNPVSLSTNMIWTPSTTSVWWGNSGSKNVNVWLQPNSGQSITYNISATNICATSTRNITFTVQSAYKIYSSTNVKSELIIEFTNTSYLEALPQTVSIYDEKNGKTEKVVEMKDIYGNKEFIDSKKLVLDVSKLSRGTKILHFDYPNTDNKTYTIETKTERILLVN